MAQFINYQTFSTLKDASNLIDLLNANQIPFEIDDSAERFDISAKEFNPFETGITVKIQASDVERVKEIDLQNAPESISDHYLYSFSDNDIIDVVVNPEEWTASEVALAKKISIERDLKPSAELVKSLRKNSFTEKEQIKEKKIQERITQESAIRGSAGWFAWIGGISLINSLLIFFQSHLYFPIGLGLSTAKLGVASGIREATGVDVSLFGLIASFIMPILFFWIWRKSRKGNQRVYLAGMIIYAIDTLFCVLVQYWFGVGLHLFALFFIWGGYQTLITQKRTKELEKESA